MVAESAQHPHVPSLAAAVAGSPIRGSWWTHPRAKTIFAITRGVRESSEVLVCRIVDGKIAFVHRRLWPALVRAAQHFPSENIARLRESHTENGRHRVEQTPFPDWVTAEVIAEARRLKNDDAIAELTRLKR